MITQGFPKAVLHERMKAMSVDHAAFIDKLLVYNPFSRMTAYEALKHPWISSI